MATGLNQGVRRVDELGLSWALLLDQDTVVDDDLVDCLAEIWRQHASPTEIGLIGANSRSTASGRLGIQSSPGASGYVELKTIVTSGSLLAMAAYERIGPFRDDFFIDGVDLEYCLRLRGFGFRVLCSRRALMTHASGKGRERRFLSRVVLVGDHEPWRYYYMLRNFVHVARAYVRREPA